MSQLCYLHASYGTRLYLITLFLLHTLIHMYFHSFLTTAVFISEKLYTALFKGLMKGFPARPYSFINTVDLFGFHRCWCWGYDISRNIFVIEYFQNKLLYPIRVFISLLLTLYFSHCQLHVEINYISFLLNLHPRFSLWLLVYGWWI